MLEFLRGLVTVISAIPAVDRFVQQLVRVYIEARIREMQKENAEAIAKAVLTGDQRPIERVIGSPTAGLPSGLPGSQIRDKLPGVE